MVFCSMLKNGSICRKVHNIKNQKGRIDIMDRRAELINLRDIRDLEVAKIYINQRRNQDWWNVYQPQINELSVGNFKEIRPLKNAKKNVKEMSVGLVAGAVIIIVAILWFVYGEARFLPLILGCIGGGLIWLFGDGYFDTVKEANEEEMDKAWNEQAEKYNSAERARIESNRNQIVQLQQKQQEQDSFWKDELSKVDELLNSAYAINIVPKPYRRNLAAIQYIYDYMSTSQVSLEHVLLATKIEEGIEIIGAKLDILISQQEEIIFQMHRQEAQNRQLMDQNEQMLASLHRTEANTLEAAQYAQLSTSYNKTCAFFAIANYLEKV